jgi:outer membrane protein TolC
MKSNILAEKLQKYTMYPSLSLGASAKANLWDSDGIKTDTIKNSFSLGLNAGISQTIYDGGKNAVRNSIAKITSEITRQDAAAAYYAALDAADSAYYGMLEALAALESAESALEAAVLALSVAEIRMQNRMMSEADYLEALAEKETRENTRNQARRDISLAGAKVKNLCGLSAVPALEGINFESYEAGITKSASLEDGQIEKLYGLLWKKVLEKNPAIAKAVLNSRSAEKQTSLAKRDYVPTLGAGFSPGGLSYTIDGGLKYSQGSFSLTGSIPLDFWVTSANVKKAKLA